MLFADHKTFAHFATLRWIIFGAGNASLMPAYVADTPKTKSKTIHHRDTEDTEFFSFVGTASAANNPSDRV